MIHFPAVVCKPGPKHDDHCGEQLVVINRCSVLKAVRKDRLSTLCACEELEAGGTRLCCYIRALGWTYSARCRSESAVHALYECCNSVPLAADLARAALYADHDALFREADKLLFGLGEASMDSILQAYPDVGRRAGSEKSRQSSVRCW